MRTLCTFLFIGYLCLLPAQNSFQGWAAEKGTEKPIEDILVSLLRENQSVITYTRTDAQGRFSVSHSSTPPPAYILFSLMGYKSLMMPLSEFSSGSTVFLEGSPLQIREVKVTSERIRQSGDTITYAVSGFRMPQDRSIADVLKKMPGIEVRPGGQITFQDRPINKLYIEGMDLMGSKYALATNNLAGKSVKEVQVLQRHQPIAALRGRNFTDQAALNLILTDEAKMQVHGTADLAGGWGESPANALWEARLLGIFFGSRMQNLTLYKSNNIGEDINSELNVMTRADLLQRQRGVDEESNLLADNRLWVPEADQEKYLFNRSHLLTTNHLFKPSKETDLRIQLSALHDDIREEYHSATEYIYPDERIMVEEEQRSKGLTRSLDGEFLYQKNSNHTYINNRLSGTLKFAKADQLFSTNGEPITAQSRPNRQNIKNDFEWIANRGRHTWNFTTVNTYTYLPQQLTVSPGLYEDWIHNGEPYSSFTQNVALHSLQSHTQTSFQHRIAGFYVRYKAGLRLRHQSLRSDLTVEEEQKQVPVANAGTDNNLTFTDIRLYAEPSVNYKDATWTVEFRIPITIAWYHLRHSLPDHRKNNYNRIFAEPTLQVAQTLNGFWKLDHQGSFLYSTTDIHRLYTGSLFQSYRQAGAYDGQLSFSRTLSWHTQLSYSNPLTGFFASISGQIAPGWQDNMQTRSHAGILTLTETLPLSSHSLLWGGSSRLSKSYAWSKLFTGLRFSYTRMQDQQYLSEQIVSYQTHDIRASADFSLQPDPKVSLEGISSLQATRYRVVDSKGRTFSHRQKLSLHLFPSKNWKISTDHILYRTIRPLAATSYFADLRTSYSFGAVECELAARNLFNNRTLEQAYIGSLVSSYSYYQFRPREFIAKVMLSF